MGRASPPLIWTKSKRTAAFFGNPSLHFNTQLKSVIISDLGETLLENLLLHHPIMSEPPDGQGVEHCQEVLVKVGAAPELHYCVHLVLWLFSNKNGRKTYV